MSFILDQLKKSGKKRELELAMRSKGGTQRRETIEAPQNDVQPTSGPGIRMRGIYLLLFLAVISLSALGGFILFRGNPANRKAPVISTETQVHTAGPSVSKAESARPESVLQVDRETPMPPKFRSDAGPERAAPVPAVVKKTQDDKVRSSTPVAVAEPPNQDGSAAEGQITAPSLPEKSEPQDDARRTPYLNELSESLKNALPPIRISSHLYRGDSRLVSINGRIMSEGINMADGLFLEEITPEGVILSFRGHRFRVRAD
jgi:general secretion pathway protein B